MIYFVTPSAGNKRLATLREALPPSPSRVFIGKGERHLATAKLLGLKKVDTLLDLLGEESRVVNDGNGGFIEILANGTKVSSSRLDLEGKRSHIEQMIRDMPDQSVAIGDLYVLRLLGHAPMKGIPPGSVYRVGPHWLIGWCVQPIVENGLPVL